MVRRFNIAEYEAMARHGILTPGDWIELVAGEIVEMPHVTNQHKGTLAALATLFYRSLPPGAAIVATQQMLAIAPDSVLSPDLMLLRYRPDFYRFRNNRPDDALLLVDIVDARRGPRDPRLRLYAENGIPECWTVDVTGRSVQISREPEDGTYASVSFASRDQRISPRLLARCVLPLGEIFGPLPSGER